MTFGPVSLKALDPEYISELYERARSHESIFRNILVNLADDEKEVSLFKTASLDSIFDKYVRIAGYETRVSDFRVGPFDNMIVPQHMFPEFKPKELSENNALVIIQKSNDNWLNLYDILENSAVKLSDSRNYHQL